MDRRAFLKFLGTSSGMLVGLPAWLSGCTGKPKIQPRLVLLYPTCTLNKSYLSPYNKNVTYTPCLEKFSSEAAVFKRHQTESGQSGNAFASIFCGCQADKHGIFDHPRKLDKSVYQVSEAFRDNGYNTYFWDKHMMASYDLGYGQGVRPENQFQRMLTADDKNFDEILDRLDTDKGYQAFIQTTFTVTHSIYTLNYAEKYHNPDTLPEEFAKMVLTTDEFYRFRDFYLALRKKKKEFFLINDYHNFIHEQGFSQEDEAKLIQVIEYLYKCGVSYLDLLFGKIINKLEDRGLLDESLIVFTADHGETLYRDNTLLKFCHGFQLEPEVLTVPLMIRGPSLGIKPKKHSFVSRSIDVFPTIGGFSGLKMPKEKSVDGVDLSPCILGKKSKPPLPAFSHTLLIHSIPQKSSKRRKSILHRLYAGRDPEYIWVSMRVEDMVFKWEKDDPDEDNFAPFAFDLAKDPEERVNLFDHRNKDHQNILKKLFVYRDRLIKTCGLKYSDLDSGMPEEESIRRLKSMGYI